MTINGFEVEKENQYNLPTNAKTSTCPLCSHTRKYSPHQKCLLIDWKAGRATCQHCGEVLQLHTFKKRKKTKEEIKTFIKPVCTNKTDLRDDIVIWFKNRKISQYTLKLVKVSNGVEYMPQIKKKQQTIQFLYFFDGELVNIKYRDKEKNFKLITNAERIFYNLDSIIIDTECIIVEGEIDCLSYIEVGLLNCVSIPNGSTIGNVNLDYIDNYYDYFENKERIYLALDNDQAGKNVTKEMIRRFGAEKCYLVDFKDCKDANEYLCKYGAEALRQTIQDAQPVPLENVTTFDDHKQDLYNFYKFGSKKGYTIGLENFDNIFSTYTKQYVVVTGIPTHGKSDFVDQMCIGYNLEYDWKIAYCSVENDPKYIHIDKICRKIHGRRPKCEDDLNNESWKITENRIKDYFFFVSYDDGYDLTNVLSKMKELVHRKGIKCFVLDPYNKIRLKSSKNKNINEYTSDYLNELDTFCKKHDVFCILVAHPVKPDTKDKSYKPNFYSIKGGGEFYDMSPHGLLVWRDFERNFTTVEVLKCKFQNLGINGAKCYFAWNSENGRYMPIENDMSDQMATPIFKTDYENLIFKKLDKVIKPIATSNFNENDVFEDVFDTNYKTPESIDF